MEQISYLDQTQPPESQYEILTGEFMRAVRNAHRSAQLHVKDYTFYDQVSPPATVNRNKHVDSEEHIARQMIMHEDIRADWERSHYYSAEDPESSMLFEITHYQGYALDPDTGERTFRQKERVEVELSLDYLGLSEIEATMLHESGLWPIINDVVSFGYDDDGILTLPRQAGPLIANGIFSNEIDFLDFYTQLLHAGQSDHPFEAYELLLSRSASRVIDAQVNARLIDDELTFEEDLAYYINRVQTISEIADFIIETATNPESQYFANHYEMFEGTIVSSVNAHVYGSYDPHQQPIITKRRLVAGVSDIEYLVDQEETKVRVYGAILDSTQTHGAFSNLSDKFMSNPHFSLVDLIEDPHYADTLGFRLEIIDDDEIAWVLRSIHTALPIRNQAEN